MAGGILVPRKGIESTPPAVETWRLNHWTAGEVPHISALNTPAKTPAQDNFTVPKLIAGFIKNNHGLWHTEEHFQA